MLSEFVGIIFPREMLILNILFGESILGLFLFKISKQHFGINLILFLSYDKTNVQLFSETNSKGDIGFLQFFHF